MILMTALGCCEYFLLIFTDDGAGFRVVIALELKVENVPVVC